MIKSVAFAAILLPLTCLPGWAQSPKSFAGLEIYGGFSALSLGGGTRTELYGWQAGMASNFTSRFGILTDFAGQYRNGINVRQSLFGPRFTMRFDGKNIFVHGLFGMSRAAGANAFTAGLGGGFDLTLNNRFAFRAIQADWLPARSAGQWSMERVRLGSAIIVSFGRR